MTQRYATGLIPRVYEIDPVGSLPYAQPLDIPLIPRSEWGDRIVEMEKNKSRLSDLCDAAGVPCLNQETLSYCHAFSPTYAVMALRASQNQRFVLLSASSVGGPVTGFRNVGAYIYDDLEQIVRHGVASVDTYPMLTTRNYWKEPAQDDAGKHRVMEWYDLEPHNFDQVMTCLLLRIPVCVALNWWEHAVTYLDPVYVSPGRFGVRGQNSWGETWGDKGRFVFPEGYGRNQATPDEAYAPRVTKAS